MAKRKRLTLPPEAPAPETKGMFTEAPTGIVPGRRAKSAPIADMAGAAAASAALEEVSAELSAARAEGRFVQKLRTTQIDAGHLMRDRVIIDSGDMDTLMASIRSRGQQTPVEVLATGPDTYGLISGWRRLAALARLYEETNDPQFAYVHALVRQPASAQDAYVAMVEENEIRVGLSYYERAQIVARTVQAGVYDSDKTALQTLFSSASRAKRSKIKSFLPIVSALGDVLHHPTAIGERMGLDLSQRLEDAAFAKSLRAKLAKSDGKTPEEEQNVLSGALAVRATKPAIKPKLDSKEELAPGVVMMRGPSGLTLKGPGVTDALADRLRALFKDE
ncbi:ParB-like nuclease [Sulfitobacter noctilucicola]|uniref:ParB-like chromosome segregation protein Spo0J n=1 Tax=Sulfitobacter noctilucicola TaxID=1342301 RepID=A0A7W6MDV3_9RHOB|nr:ParB N-terminal domain-containing protein [Sulfitobacter noctilucicola]KIN69842.1 ParB-like nuclease [Sulfitobacter noctilucicola]MBB4176211.1 ParB-like chromosome segregation protein Spo0J [Sulfitobacter noctilucicola]